MDIIRFQQVLEKQRGFGRAELEYIRSSLSLAFFVSSNQTNQRTLVSLPVAFIKIYPALD
jgi:hypothetical protein